MIVENTPIKCQDKGPKKEPKTYHVTGLFMPSD